MLVGNASRITAAIAALLALTMASGAQAQRWGHTHSRVVIGVGVPFVWPYWHYPPPYYYSPRVVVPAETVIYVEKGDAEAAPGEDPSQYWYFCRDSNTYFPYVKECPTPWQRVVPQPPPR
jgi:hypothetical protein